MTSTITDAFASKEKGQYSSMVDHEAGEIPLTLIEKEPRNVFSLWDSKFVSGLIVLGVVTLVVLLRSASKLQFKALQMKAVVDLRDGVSTPFLEYSFDPYTVSGTTLTNTGSGGATYNANLKLGTAIISTDFREGSGSLTLAGGVSDLAAYPASYQGAKIPKSQYVQVPAFTTGSNGLTFACWFRSNNNPDWARIFDFGTGVAQDNIITYIQNGYLGVTVYKGIMTNVYSQNPNVVPNVNDNIWCHFAWTITTAGTWTVYINGVNVWSMTGQVYPNAIQRSANYFGRSAWASDPYFAGALDDFQMYNTALMASDIANIALVNGGYGLPPLCFYIFDPSMVSDTVVTSFGFGGSAFNANLINGATSSASGHTATSGSVKFAAGLSQYVQMPSFTTGNTGLTFACWFRSDNNPTWARLFDFGNGSPSDNINAYINNGYLGVTVYMGTGSKISQYPNIVAGVNDNVWRHFAWTLSYSGTSTVVSTWTVYINGQQVWTMTGLPYPNAVARANNYLGKSDWSNDPYFAGAIDSFNMYYTVLSASDVRFLYAN